MIPELREALARTRVLVCGDSELQRALGEFADEFDVRLVDSYGALLPAMDAARFDVAVVASDGRDAPQILRRARERHPYARLLVVAEPKDRNAVNLLLEGVVDALLERPVVRQELLNALLGTGTRRAVESAPNPILVVSPESRDEPSLAAILGAAGLSTRSANSTDAALDALEHNPGIPLCVVDLDHPAVDWLSFLMQVHARSRCELLAVIPRNADTRISGALYHGGDCVSRPLRPDELVRRARRLYDRWMEREERESHDHAAPSVWIASRNPLMRRTLGLIESIAPTEATVCLRGELGVGKEMLARLLHDWSARAQRPFVAVNCGAMHDSLLDSELFGQDRDPLTGVVRLRRGLVELAQGGTLLLDEIDELSVGMQAKVLRLLEDREFVRIGGVEMLRSDVRVIASTHQSLEALVQQGRFDRNLYRWVMQVPLPVPPLRERIDDIPELATFLLRRIAKAYGRPIPRFSPTVIPKLLRHSWPGNVGELENALELALMRSAGTELRDVEVGPRASTWHGLSDVVFDPEGTVVDQAPLMGKQTLVALLFRHRGNAKAGSAAAALDRRTLYGQLHAFHIDPLGFQGTFE